MDTLRKTPLFLTKFIWLVFGLFWLITISLGFDNVKASFWALPLFILFVLFTYLSRNISLSIPSWLIILILILMVIVPRFIWIMNISTTPVSDFDLYYQLASKLADGQIRGTHYVDYIARYSHVFSYSFVLSWIFRVTGPSIFWAESLNILFNLGTVLFTYWLVRRMANCTTGWLAAALVAVWPSMIFYTTLISTEALYTFLQIACLGLLVMVFSVKKFGLRLLLFAALGLGLALADAVRPQGILLLIGIGIYIFFFSAAALDSSLFRRVYLILACSAAFFIFSSLIDFGIESLIGKQIGSNLGYSLFIGSNSTSYGQWNEEDAGESTEIYMKVGKNAKQWNSLMIKKAIERIKSDPLNFLGIQTEKNYNIWQHDTYSMKWTAETLNYSTGHPYVLLRYQKSLENISNIYYYIVLAVCLLTSIFGIIRDEQGLVLLIVILIWGFIIGFIFLEALNRYHYHALPLFAILASFGFDWLRNFFRTSKIKKFHLFRQRPTSE